VLQVDALTRLRHHPHVIAYRTCFLTSTVFTIITDYAAGGTLGAQIRRAKRRRLSSAGGTAAATAGSAPAGDASNAPAGAPADQGDDAARLAAASAAAPAAAAANPAALGDATAAVAPPFESSLLVRWASQLLSALGAVHDLRMMHRDVTPHGSHRPRTPHYTCVHSSHCVARAPCVVQVKPHNVFLTADLHIKLGDFGACARAHTDLT
jgi:serine/threonine protein kinase